MRWIFRCDAVLACQRAADVDAVFEDFLGGFQGVVHLRGVAVVVHEDGVDISVPAWKTLVICRPWALPFVDACRTPAACCAARRRPACSSCGSRADRAEGAFASLPEFRANVRIGRALDAGRVVPFADLDELDVSNGTCRQVSGDARVSILQHQEHC